MANAKSRTSKVKPNKGSTRKPGRPRITEQENTQENILIAALKEFSKRGFEGTRMKQIADSAGIAKPLLNYHFQSKESLWKAAINFAFSEVAAAFLQMAYELKDIDSLSRLKIFIRRYAGIVGRNPALARVIVIETADTNERSRWLLETHILPTRALGENLIEALYAENPKVKKIPPDQVVAMINGAINVYFFEILAFKALQGVDESQVDEATINDFSDNLLNVIFHGILEER